MRPYLPAFIILFFIVLFAASAAKPLHLDNMDFPAVAEQTAVTGLPIYYRGEQHSSSLGLYHPPLYIYALAAWMRVFGSGEAAVRLFGMICALLQGMVVLAILRTLFGSVLASRWGPLFWAVFLLNPYTLQTAGIADIDSTIYGPLLGLAILAALRISWRNGEWRTDEAQWPEYAALGFVLVLCFWAKLTTVLLLFPFLWFLWIARLGLWRAALTTVAIASASIAVFLGSYFLYGALTRLNVGYTFAFTWQSFVQRGSSQTPGLAARLRDNWNNLAFMGPFMLSWTGLLPWVAACGALWMAGMRARLDRRLLHYGLILSLAVISTWYYCAKVMTFGYAPYKYSFVYWGLVLTAPLLVLEQRDVRVWWTGWKASAIWVLYGSTALWAAIQMRDRLMLDGFQGPYRWVAVAPGLLFLAGLARTRYSPALLLSALSLYGGVQLGIAEYQTKAPYATTYDYGQTGFLDTVAFLRSNTGPGDIIASMKDIGYRGQRRYFETYSGLYGNRESARELTDIMGSGTIAYMVFTEERGQDQLIINPQVRQWVLEHCTLIRSFGNYRIYQLARVQSIH